MNFPRFIHGVHQLNLTEAKTERGKETTTMQENAEQILYPFTSEGRSVHWPLDLPPLTHNLKENSPLHDINYMIWQLSHAGDCAVS